MQEDKLDIQKVELEDEAARIRKRKYFDLENPSENENINEEFNEMNFGIKNVNNY